jgi:hypothetical protein
MLFGDDRDTLRQFYFRVWQKQQDRTPLEPLEQLVAEVIRLHPEYHALLSNPERFRGRDFLPEVGESNPFLHLGMHVAIAEQLGSDQPPGIRALHARLLRRAGDAHAAAHGLMACLGEVLWRAQRAATAPDEAAYLDCVRRRAGG